MMTQGLDRTAAPTQPAAAPAPRARLYTVCHGPLPTAEAVFGLQPAASAVSACSGGNSFALPGGTAAGASMPGCKLSAAPARAAAAPTQRYQLCTLYPERMHRAAAASRPQPATSSCSGGVIHSRAQMPAETTQRRSRAPWQRPPARSGALAYAQHMRSLRLLARDACGAQRSCPGSPPARCTHEAPCRSSGSTSRRRHGCTRAQLPPPLPQPHPRIATSFARCIPSECTAPQQRHDRSQPHLPCSGGNSPARRYCPQRPHRRQSHVRSKHGPHTRSERTSLLPNAATL